MIINTLGTSEQEVLPIRKGGTDSDNAADALKNLGITYGTTDLTAGTSELATGAIYLCYE